METDSGKARAYLAMASAEDSKPKVEKTRRRVIDRLPKEEVLRIICENVSLIKTIDSEMFPDIAKRVYRMLTGKLDPDRFVDWLIDECNVTEGQAYRILFDQTYKAKERMKISDWANKGREFVIWRHRKGVNEPRDYHIRPWNGHTGVRSGKPNGLDGFVFRIGDPPVIDRKTGRRGYPSDLVGCKCYMTAIREEK